MQWIWLPTEEKNTFAEFFTEFTCPNGGHAVLKLSADHRVAAYINGRLVSNGQYFDLPEHKSVDEADVSSALQKGKNTLKIVAFHMDGDHSIAHTMAAGIAFELTDERGNLLAKSSEATLCRKAAGYGAGDAITPQIGRGWKYDFCDEGEAWQHSRVVENDFREEPRPVRRCHISEPLPFEAAAQGIFSYREGFKETTAAARMQNAWLASLRFEQMTGQYRLPAFQFSSPVRFAAKGGDGVFVVADMKKETSGYLSLSVAVDKPCRASVGWGEHLSDLRVRTEIGGRNFAFELSLKKGENTFDGDLWRIGGRYLVLFVESDSVTVSKLTVREAMYPFKIVDKVFQDGLEEKIYETARRTLTLCAHEHYEDCPWREQALYGMDSRNQMLFGYGAFQEYELPRASLRLFTQCLRPDGLLELCAPARIPFTIPSFSVYWLIALYENAEANYNEQFVKEMLPYAEKVLSAFEKRTSERGVSNFVEAGYWNFYEWSEGLDGGDFNRSEDIPVTRDAILTALVYKAATELAELEKRTGNAAEEKRISAYAERLAASFEGFFDEETGLYASFLTDEGKGKTGYHAYTQAAMLFTRRLPKARAKKICKALKHPDGRMIDMTFAALQLKYDSIMMTDGDLEFCVKEIEEVFGGMLLSGATSYWETAYGEADFSDAGSLCHGWSAVACYVFDKYGIAKNAEKQ